MSARVALAQRAPVLLLLSKREEQGQGGCAGIEAIIYLRKAQLVNPPLAL